MRGEEGVLRREKESVQQSRKTTSEKVKSVKKNPEGGDPTALTRVKARDSSDNALGKST